MSYSISVRACPLDEFNRRCQMQLEANKDGMNAEEYGQAKMLMDHVMMVAHAGHVGQDWVQAEISGHCNPGHAPMVGKPDSSCSFSVSQTGPR